MAPTELKHEPPRCERCGTPVNRQNDQTWLKSVNRRQLCRSCRRAIDPGKQAGLFGEEKPREVYPD